MMTMTNTVMGNKFWTVTVNGQQIATVYKSKRSFSKYIVTLTGQKEQFFTSMAAVKAALEIV